MADVMSGISAGGDGSNDIVFRKDDVNAGGLVHAGTLDADGAFWPFQSYQWDGARWIMHLQPQRVDAPFEVTVNDGNGYVVINPG